MTDTIVRDSCEHSHVTGKGFLQVWDADKVAHVVRKLPSLPAVAAPDSHLELGLPTELIPAGTVRHLDGTASMPNLVRAVRMRHMPKSALLPQNLKASLAAVRDMGVWVPAQQLELAAKVLRDRALLPDEELDGGHNLFVTVGITRLWANFNAVPAATAVYDATHCRIGTGDTNTAAAIGNTDLAAAVAAANRYFQILDSTPSASTNQTSRTATFATGNGNYTAGWQEWCIDNGTASGATAATSPILNRAVVNLGTKTSAAQWAFTVTHSIS